MKKLVLLFVSLCCMVAAQSQGNYSVFTIDTALLRDANVVVRFEEDRYEMKDTDKAVYRYKRAITILNEKGDEHAGLYVSYDAFNSIDFIDGALYDANGKKIRSLKRHEIKDQSGTDDINLAEDSRYKEHNFYHKVYPYTVEYEYAVNRRQTMFFPSWYTQVDEFYAVEESRFTLVLPSSYQFRHKAFNYSGQPATTTQSDKTTYQWIVKKLPAIRIHYGFPGWRHVSPMVITGPTDFEIEEYKGKMTDWGEFGKFILALSQGRDVLPDPVKQQVQLLTNGKKDNREKVEALYDFLQKNTRYISIQLGIGGWRPFEASYVAKNRYGDCKALSNYMYSLLKEAGIPSHYALIRAGKGAESIVSDFPSSQFNHAILCVPLNKDTIWLECTSQDQVPGYMGSFTGNRDALVITPEGGKMVRTPTYGLKENTSITKVKATVDDNGNVTMEQTAAYTGLLQDVYHHKLSSLSKDKLKEFLSSYIQLPTFEIQDFNYTQDRKRVPVVHEQLKLSVSNYAQVTGKRLFVTPNITNRTNMKLPQQERKYPIKLDYAQAEVDSVEITLPAGYKPESIPSAQHIESAFGKYDGSYTVENNRIVYHRKFEKYNGLFDKSLYPELVKFYEQVFRADRSRVVLVKE